MTMTVTVHRLKVMFLNAAGSEIRNLINVLDWFLGEKLLLPMALKGGMWKQKVETNVRRRAWLETEMHGSTCVCAHTYTSTGVLWPCILFVLIKHITAPSRFLTCKPPACYIWPTNHKIRNHAYISIANGLPSPFNMQIS